MSTQYRDPAHDNVTGGRLIPSLEGGHPDGTWFTAVFLGPTSGGIQISVGN